jgi:mycothiol synthase
MGFQQSRALWQLRRSLYAALPPAELPAGIEVRTFEPGRDDEAWVRLNALAFRDHPEQGSWTVDDLHRRVGEPWFDPAGFFLAERDGVLLGSHWTKVHEHEDGTRVGEVYVVGVSPRAQGLGLGKALTLTGLHYLRDLGLDVILYVDADNTAAVRLYEGLGFDTAKVDVQYAAEGRTGAS